MKKVLREVGKNNRISVTRRLELCEEEEETRQKAEGSKQKGEGGSREGKGTARGRDTLF